VSLYLLMLIKAMIEGFVPSLRYSLFATGIRSPKRHRSIISFRIGNGCGHSNVINTIQSYRYLYIWFETEIVAVGHDSADGDRAVGDRAVDPA
jgi:hypothetical protein